MRQRANAQSITIAGPLSGPVIPIDLGVISSAPLTGYVNVPILTLDSAYTETATTGYTRVVEKQQNAEHFAGLVR
ncbi:MAG: hypothetical protein LBF78_08510 [Treponema sp.]|jgi:hypothetical protein|nr:hypothetical protein [Treponema sp.]